MWSSWIRFGAAGVLGMLCLSLHAADTFRVATYNLNNYLAQPSGTRPAKTPEARMKIRESIRAMRPDVLALQEIGGPEVLAELRESLRQEGLDFPHWEHVAGWDTNIHVAVLSRLPIVARRPHTNDSYLLGGRRLHVSRGFAEVDIQVNARYSFTLFVCHLKSRRTVAEADESDMRQQEARILREKINTRLAAASGANIVVAGDFNDVFSSPTVREISGRGRNALVDTRPAERNGDPPTVASSSRNPSNVTWTHFYAKEDTYSRIDYLMLSPGMAREWQPDETRVLSQPGWGTGSDHRPIVAEFKAEDR